MTTREALHTYREKTAGKAPHERVYFFHAHIYYDSQSKDETTRMHEVKAKLEQQYSGDDHVEVHTLQVGKDHHSLLTITLHRDASLQSYFACLTFSFAGLYDRYLELRLCCFLSIMRCYRSHYYTLNVQGK